MIIFLNGKFVPEEQALVSVFDRSFLYGDGLFETMLVANGVPFRWEQHMERLERGAAFLSIRLPFGPDKLRAFATELIYENRVPEALLRVTISRGVGVRGYSPRGADSPVSVMSLHPAPVMSGKMTWKLTTASVRLPANEPLAQLKHCNKLAQILGRAQAEEAGADEALLLNTDGFIVEGASSNLFWIENGTVCTAPLASGILSGVTRLVVVELCQRLGLKCEERQVTPLELLRADGVFVSLSSYGIVAGASLDGKALRQSNIVGDLHRAYVELVKRETTAHQRD